MSNDSITDKWIVTLSCVYRLNLISHTSPWFESPKRQRTKGQKKGQRDRDAGQELMRKASLPPPLHQIIKTPNSRGQSMHARRY